MHRWTRSTTRARTHALGALATVLAAAAATASGAAADPPAGPHPSDARVEQELRREAAVRADRDTPAGHSRRAESRRAYAGIGRDAAIGIAMQRHPELVLSPAWRGPFMQRGQSIVAYLSDFAARISDGTVVDSTVPLRAGEDDAPVDLRLDAGNSAVAPRNAIAPFRIGRELRDGVALGRSGVRLTPLDAEGAGGPEVVGDTAFFHGAYEDGDYVVKPVPTGFSVNVQIRSEASPERYRLRVDVPDGRRLREVRERQVIEVVDGDGEVEAAISAPRAWDADHEPVELDWSLDGQVIDVHVPHRAHGGAYPYLLDPTVMESYDWERSQNHNYNGWNHFKDTKNGNNIAWHHGHAFLGHGIYAYLLNTMDYNHDDSAGWFFRAPGTARVNRTEFNYTTQDWTDGTCLTLGIHKPRPAVNGVIPDPSYRTGYWNGLFAHSQRSDRCDRLYHLYCGLCNVCGETDWTPSNSVVYGIRFDGSRTRSYFWTHVGVVYVYMYDPDTPWIVPATGGIPSGWVNWSATTPIKIHAGDQGLGLRRFSLTSKDVTAYDSTTWKNAYNTDTWDGRAWVDRQFEEWKEGVTGWCQRTTVCPQTFATFGNTGATADARNAEVGNLPEGENSLRAVGQDPIGRVRKHTYVLKLDRTGPDIRPSGPLYDRRGQELPPGTYDLDVDAFDGTPGTTDPRQKRSGTREIEISVDGQRVERPLPQDCPGGSCSMHADYTFDTSDYRGGEHTVSIKSEDQIGNTSTTAFKVYTNCCLKQPSDWGTFEVTHDWQLHDVDGDLDADVVGRHRVTGDVDVALSNGQTFGARERWGNVPPSRELYYGDVNGDTLTDLVAREAPSGDVYVSLSTRHSFGTASRWGNWPLAKDVHLADVDQLDGDDLVGRHGQTGDVEVASAELGSFGTAVKWGNAAPGDYAIAVADVDNDDMADLILRDRETDEARVGLAGEGAFAATTVWGTWPSGTPTAQDLQDDGLGELAGFDATSGDFWVAVANGTVFSAAARWGTLDPAHGTPDFGDVNGDAIPDVVQRTATGTLRVYLSNAMAPPAPAASPYVPVADDVYDDTPEFSDPPPSGATVRTAQATCMPQPSAAVRNGPRLMAQDDPVFSAQGPLRDAAYARLREAGVSIIRFNAYWGEIEADTLDTSGNPQYNWSRLDAALRDAKCAGFDTYITLLGAATFDQDCKRGLWPTPLGCKGGGQTGMLAGDYTEPRAYFSGRSHRDAWWQFVRAAIERYTTTPDVFTSVFGVWNEPNNLKFLGTAGPADGSAVRAADFFRQLYTTAWEAVHPPPGSPVPPLFSGTSLFMGQFSEGKRRALDTREFIERVATGPTLYTNGVAVHPYQHIARPEESEVNKFGIGALGGLERTVRNLARSSPPRLVTPAGRIPRLYATEFGYWNRQPFNRTNPNIPRLSPRAWHPEAERAEWWEDALDQARRPNNAVLGLRWMTIYHVVEATPDDAFVPPTASSPGCPDGGEEHPLWDMGLIGRAGEIDGMRCYGTNGDRTEPLAEPQNRGAFCAIVRWVRNENRLGRGPYPISPPPAGMTPCPP